MNKVTLNANNLQGYFSPVGPLHSHHGEHLWPYDYVDRDSDTLLVTIGDSWTWGSGITGNYIEAGNLTKQENDFRLQHLYGGIIAKAKKCNWLNLGFYSAGNRWISNKVFELRALMPLLNFKKVIVICTLTSTGRWLNTWQDSLTDYKKYFTNHAMDTMDSWENFFVDINRQCISEIKLLTSSDSRIELFVGTNAVDHSGFDVLDIQQIIPQPWYKLLGDLNLDGITVDMESIRYLANLENVLSNTDQKFIFQKWMLHKISQAETQNKMLSEMDHVAGDKVHVNSDGHRIWAEYLLKDVI